MKLETYLDAMQYAQNQAIRLSILMALDPYIAGAKEKWERRDRQYRAFRARILRMANQGWCFHCGRREFDDVILHTYDCKYSAMERRIAELENEMESESKWANHYFNEWQKSIGSEYGERKR